MTLKELLQSPSIKGVCIGWCPDPQAWPKLNGIHAHAHYQRGKYFGLICISSNRHYNITTVRHELCHLLRGNPRHDSAFWALVREHGGRKERGYE